MCGEGVGKTRTICAKDDTKRRRTAKLAAFSEDPQENPPDTIVQKYKQASFRGLFPPIHRTRHNNKTPFFSKMGLRTVAGVNGFSPCESRAFKQPRSSVCALKFLYSRYFPQRFRGLRPLYFAKKRVQYASG
jgi:hypothetical protein